jgi:hypothetical protein
MEHIGQVGGLLSMVLVEPNLHVVMLHAITLARPKVVLNTIGTTMIVDLDGVCPLRNHLGSQRLDVLVSYLMKQFLTRPRGLDLFRRALRYLRLITCFASHDLAFLFLRDALDSATQQYHQIVQSVVKPLI